MNAKKIQYALLILCTALIFWKLFLPGFTLSTDNPVHLAESQFLVDTIKQTGWISGISEYDYAGFPERVFQYQTGQWFVALLYFILSVPVEIGYKIMLFASVLFPCLMLYRFLSRKYDANAAFFASVFFLLIPHTIMKMFQGMWSLVLSLGFLIWFIDHYDLHKNKLTAKDGVLLALLFSLMMLSHPYGAAMAGIFLVVSFVQSWVVSKKMPRLTPFALALLLPLVLLAFYLGPLVELSAGWALKTPRASFQFIDMIREFVMNSIFTFVKNPYTSGTIIQTMLVSLPMLIVAVFACKAILSQKKHDDFTRTMFVMLLASFIMLSGFWLLPGINKIPILNIFEAPRFSMFAQFFLLIFACAAFSERKSSKIKKKSAILPASLLLVVLLAAVYANIFVINSKLAATSEMPQTKQIYDVWNWIKNNVDGSKFRVIYQDTGSNSMNPSFRDSHAFAPSYMFTNVPSIGGWMGHTPLIPTVMITNTDAGSLLGSTVDAISYDELKSKMSLLNAKYIVSSEPKLKHKLENSSMFKKEFETADFSIFSLNGYASSWFMTNASISAVSFSTTKITFNETSMNATRILIKKQYVPYWEASIDGVPTTISDVDAFMQISVPVGTHAVSLQYHAIRWTYVFISMFGILLSALFFALGKDANLYKERDA